MSQTPAFIASLIASLLPERGSVARSKLERIIRERHRWVTPAQFSQALCLARSTGTIREVFNGAAIERGRQCA